MNRFFIFIFTFCSWCIEIFAASVGGDIIRPSGTIDSTSVGWAGIISGIIKYGVGIAGVLGVIGIVWGGIQMILSVGEDEKMKKARFIVIYSIVGVVIAGLAYTVVSLLTQTQINLTQ